MSLRLLLSWVFFLLVTDSSLASNLRNLSRREIENVEVEEEFLDEKVWNKMDSVGQWSSWSEGRCDTVCGKGKIFRRRICIGSGEFGIVKCRGSAIERRNESCFINCPTIQQLRDRIFGRNLSSQERQLYRNFLSSSDPHSYRRKTGEKIHFDCDLELNRRILTNYTNSVLFWNKNDRHFGYDFPRMKISKFSILEIYNLTTNDSGVYSCNIEISKSETFLVQLFALTVIGRTIQRFVHLNERINVTCNSQVLARIYSSFYIRWIVEDSGIVVKNYGITAPEKVDKDYFGDLRKEFSGIWSCIVTDVSVNKTWTTNSFRVQIMNRSYPFFTWLQKYVSIRTASIASATFLLVIVITLITACFVNKKREKELMSELENILELYEAYKRLNKDVSEHETDSEEKDASPKRETESQDSFEDEMKNILQQLQEHRSRKSYSKRSNLF